MKKSILFITLFLIHSLVFSQINEYSKLNLYQCYEIATKNNPEILIYNSQISSNNAAIDAAFGSFLPSINFSMGYNRQLNQEGAKSFNIGGQTIFLPQSNPNSYNMNVIANYTLFNGFERESNYIKAQKSLEAFNNNKEYTIKRVFNDIYNQYIDIIRNIQIINLRKENYELAKKDLEKIKAQFEAGVIPNTLIFTQEAEIGNRELEIIKAENDFKKAKSLLLSTIGLNPDLDVEFIESSIPNILTKEIILENRTKLSNFEVLLNKILNNRQDYLALKLNMESKEYDIIAAKSTYYPRLSASSGWTWSNSEFNKFSDLGRYYLGLNLSVPIFDNFNTNYQIENAKFQLNQSKYQLFQFEQNLKAQLKSAMLSLESAEKQWEIALKTSLASEKSYESVKERFNVGVVSISDYYLATNQKINSQINLLTSIYNYYSALNQIKFIIGDK